MDHIVYLDGECNELENLITGKKSMIIRGADSCKLLHGKVNEGDILYFANNNCKGEIKARGIVSSVCCTGMLTIEESFETIIRNQDKLQLPDSLFDSIAGSSYLVLVGVKSVEHIPPVKFSINGYANLDDWLPVGNIEKYILSARGIISA